MEVLLHTADELTEDLTAVIQKYIKDFEFRIRSEANLRFHAKRNKTLEDASNRGTSVDLDSGEGQEGPGENGGAGAIVPVAVTPQEGGQQDGEAGGAATAAAAAAQAAAAAAKPKRGRPKKKDQSVTPQEQEPAPAAAPATVATTSNIKPHALTIDAKAKAWSVEEKISRLLPEGVTLRAVRWGGKRV
jgi:hypothetical protein